MDHPQTFQLPNGRTVVVNYPTPKTHPITDEHRAANRLETIEVTRMDFLVLEGAVIVNKLGMNQYVGRTVVTEHRTHAGFDLEGALAWCLANGWAVRRWPGGARAWKYGLAPVRSTAEIIRLRDELRAHPRAELAGMAHTLDLKYDL